MRWAKTVETDTEQGKIKIVRQGATCGREEIEMEVKRQNKRYRRDTERGEDGSRIGRMKEKGWQTERKRTRERYKMALRDRDREASS